MSSEDRPCLVGGNRGSTSYLRMCQKANELWITNYSILFDILTMGKI